jgi:hypothetical protein
MKKEKKVKKVKEIEIVDQVMDLQAHTDTPVKEVIGETSEDLGQVGINALAKKVNELVRKVNTL